MPRSKHNGTSLEQLESEFRQKKFAPIYLLYGEEDYLVEQAVNSLIENALDDDTKGFNLDVVHGNSVDGRDIVSLASAFPMMAERRVLILRDMDRLPNKELLLPLIEKPVSSTVMVLISAKPDFRLKVLKSLEKTARVVEFLQLYENEVPGWIGARIEKLGKRVSHEACQLIHASVGRSLREIQNEIDKLFIFVGQKETIGEEDVAHVVGMSKQFNVFELQRTIGSRRMGRSM